jgi:hypothetical protein
MVSWLINRPIILICWMILMASLITVDAQIPSLSVTSQPTQLFHNRTCDLDAYDNRNQALDSQDCKTCYDDGCAWFDCEDIDADTASGCYDPFDEYKLETCTRYTSASQCQTDYSSDICIAGGTVLLIFGACVVVATTLIRYNEIHAQKSKKIAENEGFLDEDGSISEAYRGSHVGELNDKIDISTSDYCCDCESGTFWCYAGIFFTGASMMIIGISFLIAYSILGSHVFDNIKAVARSIRRSH